MYNLGELHHVLDQIDPTCSFTKKPSKNLVARSRCEQKFPIAIASLSLTPDLRGTYCLL